MLFQGLRGRGGGRAVNAPSERLFFFPGCPSERSLPPAPGQCGGQFVLMGLKQREKPVHPHLIPPLHPLQGHHPLGSEALDAPLRQRSFHRDEDLVSLAVAGRMRRHLREPCFAPRPQRPALLGKSHRQQRRAPQGRAREEELGLVAANGRFLEGKRAGSFPLCPVGEPDEESGRGQADIRRHGIAAQRLPCLRMLLTCIKRFLPNRRPDFGQVGCARPANDLADPRQHPRGGHSHLRPVQSHHDAPRLTSVELHRPLHQPSVEGRLGQILDIVHGSGQLGLGHIVEHDLHPLPLADGLPPQPVDPAPRPLQRPEPGIVEDRSEKRAPVGAGDAAKPGGAGNDLLGVEVVDRRKGHFDRLLAVADQCVRRQRRDRLVKIVRVDPDPLAAAECLEVNARLLLRRRLIPPAGEIPEDGDPESRRSGRRVELDGIVGEFSVVRKVVHDHLITPLSWLGPEPTPTGAKALRSIAIIRHATPRGR